MKKVRCIHAAMLPLAGNKLQHRLRIAGDGNLSDNADMNTYNYRRANLAAVMSQLGLSKADLARRAEMPPPNVTQILNGKRPFGADIARRLEELLSLRYGYLDEEVPLTDQALHLARVFQSLSEEHRREVQELTLTLQQLEEHMKQAKTILRRNDMQG